MSQVTNPKMKNLIGDVVGKKVGTLSKKNQIEEMIDFLKNSSNTKSNRKVKCDCAESNVRRGE